MWTNIGKKKKIVIKNKTENGKDFMEGFGMTVTIYKSTLNK